jgi:DNA-binding MarR family transcriptional regulator
VTPDDPKVLLEIAPRLVRELFGARAPSDTAAGPVALQVLMVLHDTPGADPDDIGGRLGLDGSTVRHAIRKLKAAGLLKSERGSRELTAKGDRRARQIVTRAQQLLADHAKPQG